MKTLLITLLLFSSFYNTSYAQNCPVTFPTPCSNTPFNGNLNLVDSLYAIDSVMNVSYARPMMPSGFGDVKYNADYKDCLPAGADSCTTSTANLVMDFYYPSNYSGYSSCALPVIILLHAGGFSDCNSKDQIPIQVICRELAKRAYIVINVEYREGTLVTKDKPPGIPRTFTTVQQQLAAYRACQDARGAFRSVIQLAINHTYDSLFRMDTNNIFVGGASAGGIAAMNAAWYTPAMVAAVFPAGAGSPTTQQALGFINTNYYLGAATIDYQSKIRGTVTISSAIAIPYSYDTAEYKFFDSTLLKPHIGFHGYKDQVFPYPDSTTQRVYFAPRSYLSKPYPYPYNRDTLCIGTGQYYLDTTDMDGASPDQINGSALNMRKILKHFGIANETYVDLDLGHVPITPFNGNYGTCATNQIEAAIYQAQRIATFFQAILSGRAGNIGTDYFADCENTRHGCTGKTTTVCTNCK